MEVKNVRITVHYNTGSHYAFGRKLESADNSDDMIVDGSWDYGSQSQEFQFLLAIYDSLPDAGKLSTMQNGVASIECEVLSTESTDPMPNEPHIIVEPD